ncbi:MAG: hypothetical protein HY871_00385 [Chloroflexi bacterium]|nr:hypothetical protein [Chloroflexota bacterium]
MLTDERGSMPVEYTAMALLVLVVVFVAIIGIVSTNTQLGKAIIGKLVQLIGCIP